MNCLIQGTKTDEELAAERRLMKLYEESERAREAPAYVIWKQRDGTPIRVRDMDDKHLFNTIRMLERNTVRLAAKYEALANRHEHEGFIKIDPARILRRHKAYQTMVAVAMSRGIDLSAPPTKEKEAHEV
jgi:hypothetical protein